MGTFGPKRHTMSDPEPPSASSILYSALHSPCGLLVRTTGGFDKARSALYATRRQLGDPRLNVLELRSSGLDGGDLVILKVERK